MFSHGCEQGVGRVTWQTNRYLSCDLLGIFAHYSRTVVPGGAILSNLHFVDRFALSVGLDFKVLIYCIERQYQKVLWATCCTWNKDWDCGFLVMYQFYWYYDSFCRLKMGKKPEAGKQNTEKQKNNLPSWFGAIWTKICSLASWW